MPRPLLLLTCALLACCSTIRAELPDQKPDSAKRELAPYQYPDAPDRTTLTLGSIRHLRQNTPDSFDTVLKWYEKSLGATLPTEKDGQRKLGGATAKAEKDGVKIVVNESSEKSRGLKARPVQMCIFIRDAKAHMATLVISRAEGEKDTYITVTYVPKK
jgi:hypothetical protein